MKIQLGQVDSMSPKEHLTNRPFEINDGNVSEAQDANEHGLFYAERALRRRTSDVKNVSQKFMDLYFLIPSSKICEMLFSKSGYALNDRRRGINPDNLESQLFLHVNNDLWTVHDFTNLSKVDDNA